jgi:hypothetical protein
MDYVEWCELVLRTMGIAGDESLGDHSLPRSRISPQIATLAPIFLDDLFMGGGLNEPTTCLCKSSTPSSSEDYDLIPYPCLP